MKLVNLTPHEIVIVRVDGHRVSFPSQGVARVETTPGKVVPVAGLDGIRVHEWGSRGQVIGLPDHWDCPSEPTGYIVSSIVAAAIRELRSDPETEESDNIFVPGTGPGDGAIRDAKGQIVAVTRLIRA